MPTMLVIEETPKKIVLEMDASQPKYNPWKGCVLPIILINSFVMPLFIIRARFYHFGSSQFWKDTIIVSLVEVALISIFVAILHQIKNEAKEATVSIDLGSQQAVRVEKLNSGKIKQYDLKLEQVTHVLIHGDDLGHRLKVTLESQNNPPFNVNSDVFYYPGQMAELGKKLGTLIKKPVVFKITDAGKPVSEETIQP